MPKETTKDLSPGFFRSMYELHIVMKNVNNNLKPKQDEVVSRPQDWPALYKGMSGVFAVSVWSLCIGHLRSVRPKFSFCA